MTNEQANDLAQECGFTPAQVSMYQKELQRFAVVVRNQALEEAAVICDELQDVPATEPRHCAQDIRGLKS